MASAASDIFMSHFHTKPSKKWKKFKSIHRDHAYGVVAPLNNCSFVSLVRPSKADKKSNPNHKRYAKKAMMKRYNAHKNEWEQFMAYPNNFSSIKHTLTYDSHNKKLILFGKCPQITLISPKNKCLEIIANETGMAYPSLTAVPNGITHVIGGKGNAKHLIWNGNAQKWNENTKLRPHNWPMHTNCTGLFAFL